MHPFFRHALRMAMLVAIAAGPVCVASAVPPDQVQINPFQSVDKTGSSRNPVEQLQRYIDAVLAFHPEMQEADARVAAAEARAEGMDRPLYNPELVLDGQRGQSDSYSAGINLTVDASGKRSARWLSGQKQLEQAIAERDTVRQQLASNITVALADYYGKQTALTLAQQRLDLLSRFSAIAERQYQAGDTGILDRNLGNLAQAEAVAIAGRAELEQLQARRALDAVTRNATLEPPALPLTPPDPSALATHFEELARALPQMRVANARTEAAMADVEIARSNRQADPTFGIRGGRESSSSEPARALIGLQVTIPLFVRNNFRAEQRAAAAAADVTRIESDALYRQITAHMQATARQYTASYAAWDRWSAASAKRLDDGIALLDKVWKVREISTSEYLVQLKQLLDGRAAGEELKYQTWRAWADWLEASGQWDSWRDMPAPARSTSAPSTSSGY